MKRQMKSEGRRMADGVVALLCMVCVVMNSCGSGPKPPVSGGPDTAGDTVHQTAGDSVQALTDSAAYRLLHAEETLKVRTAEILDNYVETEGALSDLYFSEGFRAAIAKWNQDSTHEYWTLLWNTGSVYAIERHTVTAVTAVGDSTARVGFTLTLKDITGDGAGETTANYVVRLVLADGQWMADNFEHDGETAR